MKKIIKNPIFAFILGILLTSSIVYAYVFRAQDIDYDNTNSNLVDSNNNSIDNVQDAIDVLYERAADTIHFNGTITNNEASSISVISGKKYVINTAWYIDSCNGGSLDVYSISLSGCTTESQSNVAYRMVRATSSGLYRHGYATKTFIVTATSNTITASISRATDSNSYTVSYITAVQID